MIIWVAIFLLFVSLLLNVLLKWQKWYGPLSIFSLVWLIILVAYKSRLVQLNSISSRGQLIILLGIISFLIGAFPFKKETSHNYVSKTFNLTRNGQTKCGHNKRLLHVLCYFCIFFCGVEAFYTIRLLLSGTSFSEIGLNRQFFDGGTIWTFFTVFFSYPFVYAVLPIGALNFVKKDGDKKAVILSLIIALLKVFHHGGRSTLLYYLVFLLLFHGFLGKKNRVGRKTVFLLLATVCASVIAFVYFSALRGISDLGQSLYLYLCGCLPNLDGRIDFIQSYDVTLGGSSFYGIISPIMFVHKGLFGQYPSFIVDLQEVVNTENIIQIGHNTPFNAFVTPLYYFYADGRWFGVIAGMFLLGFIAQKAFDKAITKKTDGAMILYAMFFFQIIFSMIRLHFATYQFALAFVYILILYPGNKQCNASAFSYQSNQNVFKKLKNQ